MKINLKLFYLIGAVLMGLVVIFNFWNLIVNWEYFNLPNKLSFIFGSIFFQFLIGAIFLFMYKNTPQEFLNDTEIDKLIKEVQANEIIKKEV